MSSSALRTPRRGRALAGAATVAVVALTASACGGSSGGSEAAAGATVVNVALNDSGCSPTPATVAAGPITFKVKNSGGASVTEAELMKGTTILGEKENLTPGLSGSFSLRLEPGTYTMNCPDAKQEDWTFTVTGATSSASVSVDTADLTAATTAYKAYVLSEVAALSKANKKFTDAVRAGNIAEAKKQYPLAREHYEAIEPVAESFGNLDPLIDFREADLAKGQKFTGFHRIEKALWKENSLTGMTPVADQLDANIATLAKKVESSTYQPAQLANGATELLNEVGASKITGEEDTFSHTDLYDFQANVDGAKKAFELLVPALQKVNPTLVGTINARFQDVDAALDPYRKGDGFVDYSTVTDAQRRVLTQKVDALAEPLSTVAGQIA